MKQVTTFLALAAGLGVSLITGAHAQTITGTSIAGQQYSIDLALNLAPPAYTYNYVTTLQSVAPNVSVDSFTFQFQEPVQFKGVTGGGFTLDSSDPANGSLFRFAAPVGLANQGDNATFTFYSPDAPNGSVGVASTGQGSSGAAPSFGPLPCTCPAVPEPASLALLSLGAPALALLARRRRTRH